MGSLYICASYLLLIQPWAVVDILLELVELEELVELVDGLQHLVSVAL
jgi:hypothetical protein